MHDPWLDLARLGRRVNLRRLDGRWRSPKTPQGLSYPPIAPPQLRYIQVQTYLFAPLRDLTKVVQDGGLVSAQTDIIQVAQAQLTC